MQNLCRWLILKRNIFSMKKLLKKVIKKINMKLLLMFIIIIFVVISFRYYKKNIEVIVNDNTTSLLQDIIDEGTDVISIKMDDAFNKMEGMASFIGQYDNIQCQEVLDALATQTGNDILMISGVIRLDGLGVTINGENFQADFGDLYFEEALSGERSISSVLYSEENKQEYIILAVPISQNDSITGVLQCAYDIKMFTGLIGETSIGRKGTTFIAQNDGTLVSRPEAIGSFTNLFELLDSFSSNEARISKLKKQIQNGKSGIATLNSGKYKRYVCYSTIPATEWYAVSIVSASAIENATAKITHYALLLSVGITVVFAIYIAYWFIVNYINSRKMHMKEQRYHIVANQSDSIVFEYNWRDKTAYHTHKWVEKFGYPPVSENYIENMVSGDVVYKDDIDKFRNIFRRLEEDGSEYEENFVRINDVNKKPIDCKIRATAIRNRRKHIIRVVGKILELKDYTK